MGETKYGEILEGPFYTTVGSVGTVEPSVARFLNSLVRGCFEDQDTKPYLPITTLGNLANVGHGDRSIGQVPIDGEIREPKETQGYKLHHIESKQSPKHIILWWSSSKPEVGFSIEPDLYGEPNPVNKDLAEKQWQNAARLHIIRDLSFTSNPLMACFTPTKSMGGRSWPTAKPNKAEWEIPLLIWCNTTLGSMYYWLLGSRTQPGRATLTVSRLPELPVLDVAKLDSRQLEVLEDVYRTFDRRKFLNASQSYMDSVRQELDMVFLIEVCRIPQNILQNLLPEIERVREAWCREPTVHGGHSSRPQAQSPGIPELPEPSELGISNEVEWFKGD